MDKNSDKEKKSRQNEDEKPFDGLTIFEDILKREK